MLYCFFPSKKSERTTFYDQYGAISFCAKSWLLHSCVDSAQHVQLL